MLSLLAASYGPIEDIEVFWTLIALVGAIFSSYNLKEARKDLQALSTIDKNNGRGKLGRLAVRNEAARLLIQIIFLIIGALAMTIKSVETPPGTPWNLLLLSIIFRWGLIVSSILVSLQSYLGYRLRRDFAHEVLYLSHQDDPPSIATPSSDSV